MQEQFVTYEIALKLKELGFDEECLKLWEHTEFYTVLVSPREYKKVISERFIKAPLWQQVIDWFREKHNMSILIPSFRISDKELAVTWRIMSTNFGNINADMILTSYEEAREQAILKAIESCQKEK